MYDDDLEPDISELFYNPYTGADEFEPYTYEDDDWENELDWETNDD